jgi:hypothetical protein
LKPSAAFLELGLSGITGIHYLAPSNSEKCLTQPASTGFLPKGSSGAHKNNFSPTRIPGSFSTNYATHIFTTKRPILTSTREKTF